MSSPVSAINRAAGDPAAGARAATRACERCGASARVCILAEYAGGQPVYRWACLHCADPVVRRGHDQADGRRARLNWAIALVSAGLMLGVAGALADELRSAGARGFGMYQALGVVIGAALTLSGAMLRVGTLAASGFVLFALAAGADAFRTGDSAGFGWKQVSAVAVGVALVGGGMVLELSRKIHPVARE